MSSRQIGLVLTLVILALFPAYAHAERIFFCDYACGNAGQRAMEIARISGPNFEFSIMDAEHETIDTYRTIAVPTDWGETIMVPQLISTPGTTENTFAEVMHAKAQFTQEAERRVVPSDIATSAYQLVGSGSARNNVGEWLWNDFSLVEKYYAYVSLIAATIGELVGNINVTVEVFFADGSSSLYKVNGVNADGEVILDYLPGESVDADNNSIPEIRPDFEGEFNFTQSISVREFIAAAERLGIRVQTSCLAPQYRVHCISTSQTEISCTAYYLICP